jgi:hypothetical protein
MKPALMPKTPTWWAWVVTVVLLAAGLAGFAFEGERDVQKVNGSLASGPGGRTRQKSCASPVVVR